MVDDRLVHILDWPGAGIINGQCYSHVSMSNHGDYPTVDGSCHDGEALRM